MTDETRNVTIRRARNGYVVRWKGRALGAPNVEYAFADFAEAAAQAWRELDDILPGIPVDVTTEKGRAGTRGTETMPSNETTPLPLDEAEAKRIGALAAEAIRLSELATRSPVDDAVCAHDCRVADAAEGRMLAALDPTTIARLVAGYVETTERAVGAVGITRVVPSSAAACSGSTSDGEEEERMRTVVVHLQPGDRVVRVARNGLIVGQALTVEDEESLSWSVYEGDDDWADAPALKGFLEEEFSASLRSKRSGGLVIRVEEQGWEADECDTKGNEQRIVRLTAHADHDGESDLRWLLQAYEELKTENERLRALSTGRAVRAESISEDDTCSTCGARWGSCCHTKV